MNADLTIIIPSYNRGKYIKECLDSIFMQETSYSYQLIVADDHSTDNSVEIIKEYQAKYPNKITLLESDVNQKLYKNVLRAYEITKTPYFTVLDPDDFWIDKNFIQNSLDFLEKNKDFTIYAANAYIQNEYDINSRKPFVDIKQEKNITFQDFLKTPAFIGWTGATIFRNSIFINGIPDKMVNLEHPTCEKSFRGDSFRNLIALNKGKCHFCPKITSVYRQTNSGIYAGGTDLDRDILNIRLYINLWNYFDKKYPELLLFAYKIYKNTKENLYSYIKKETNLDTLKIKISELEELDKIFKNNKKLLFKTTVKKAKPKYKIFLLIFRKLEKKLKRKGLI